MSMFKYRPKSPFRVGNFSRRGSSTNHWVDQSAKCWKMWWSFTRDVGLWMFYFYYRFVVELWSLWSAVVFWSWCRFGNETVYLHRTGVVRRCYTDHNIEECAYLRYVYMLSESVFFTCGYEEDSTRSCGQWSNQKFINFQSTRLFSEKKRIVLIHDHNTSSNH